MYSALKHKINQTKLWTLLWGILTQISRLTTDNPQAIHIRHLPFQQNNFQCYVGATALKKTLLVELHKRARMRLQTRSLSPPPPGGDSSLNRFFTFLTRSMGERRWYPNQTKPNQTSPRPVWTGSGAARALEDSLPSCARWNSRHALTLQKNLSRARACAHPSPLPSASLPLPLASPIGSCGNLKPPVVIASYWLAVRTLSCDWSMWVRDLLAHWLVRAVHEREGKSCKRKARAGKAEA